MKLYLLKLSLGTALALASFASGPDEVRYAPEKGLKVTRTCETSSEFELESESVTVDGEERLDPRKKSSGSLSIEEKFVVSDELVAVGSGRPEKLARTFDELHQQQTASETRFDGEVMEQTQKLTCDLEGKRVVFTWNADDERFDVQAAADQKLDAELLDGLDEDMDLRAFLPDKPVAKGDSWDVEPAAFHAVLWPGGRLPFHDADKHEPDEIEHEMNAAFYASLDGDAKVTYAGQREEDGVKVFVLHVKADLSRTGESVPSSEYTSEHGGAPGAKVNGEFTTQAEGRPALVRRARALDLADPRGSGRFHGGRVVRKARAVGRAGPEVLREDALLVRGRAGRLAPVPRCAAALLLEHQQVIDLGRVRAQRGMAVGDACADWREL